MNKELIVKNKRYLFISFVTSLLGMSYYFFYYGKKKKN